MHLTCTNMPVDKLKDALVKVGVRAARCARERVLWGKQPAARPHRQLVAGWAACSCS